MAYYKTCIRCGSHLDPGEICECDVERENLMCEALCLFLQLPAADRRKYLAHLKKISENAAPVLERQERRGG